MTTVSVEAWAKLNLYLHVTGKRSDGYHLLDSLVVFAGIGDTVTVCAAPSLSLTVNGPTASLLATDSCDDNMVLRAARALAARANVPALAHIHLTKRLPVAAGIGGGSADAAATLRALIQLWNLRLSEPVLADLALGLGADVPVCLRGRPTRMQGVGEILSEGPALPAVWVVLVNPLIGLSTPAVFKARSGDFSPPAPLGGPIADAAALAASLARRGNDLAAPAITLVPVIADMLALLESQPNCLLARMSGSGATCFALFSRQGDAAAAAAAMTTLHPDWWTKSAPLISSS